MRVEDYPNGDIGYFCKCGKRVRVPASEQVSTAKDYCGCGKAEIILPESEVTENRKHAKLYTPV